MCAAYNSFDSPGTDPKFPTDLQNNEPKTLFLPHFAPPEASKTQEEFSQAIASSFTPSYLPVPEPTAFTGDPLKSIDWKISFNALIGQPRLPVNEKKCYISSVILQGRHARLLRDFSTETDEDDQGAWAVWKSIHHSKSLQRQVQ